MALPFRHTITRAWEKDQCTCSSPAKLGASTAPAVTATASSPNFCSSMEKNWTTLLRLLHKAVLGAPHPRYTRPCPERSRGCRPDVDVAWIADSFSSDPPATLWEQKLITEMGEGQLDVQHTDRLMTNSGLDVVETRPLVGALPFLSWVVWEGPGQGQGHGQGLG